MPAASAGVLLKMAHNMPETDRSTLLSGNLQQSTHSWSCTLVVVLATAYRHTV
jgi:hypothetical protein